MAMTYIYRSPTTPAGPGWTVDLGNQAVRLGDVQGLIMEAEMGSVGISSLRFDDPTGTAGHDADAIVGLKQFTVNELLADNNNRRIFEGYIGDRRYARGTNDASPSLRTQAARVIDMSLVDINTFLSFRVFRNGSNTSFNRPAETDVQRITALLDTDQLSGTLFDNGLFSTASAVDMDAVDYTQQRPADVLNDCAQQSGKNFFVYYDEVANQFSLFYDFNDSLVYPAYDPDLKVSNVLADVTLTANVATGPVWEPMIDAVLVRDPSRVVAGVFIANGSNSIYQTNLTTSYTYGFRDAVGNSANLKTVAQATTRAVRYLSENSTEDDRITFTLKLPAAHVNDWKEGQYAPVKFSHIPGYEDYVNVRCLCRTVAQDEATDEFYSVKYEVTPMTGLPSGATDEILYGDDYSGTPTLPRETTPGFLLTAVIGGGAKFAGHFPSEPRFLDDPPVSPASPAVPPFSPAQSAAWTVLGSGLSDFTGMNVGGPTATSGQIASIAYRFVQPAEVTTAPVQVSGTDAHDEMGAFLWEFPTTIVPTLVGTKGRTNIANPGHATLPAGTGHLLAIFVFTQVDYGNQPISVTADAGTTIIRSVAADNDPTLNAAHSWHVPWVVIVELPIGGTPGVTFTAIPDYTTVNYCGVVIELPSNAAPAGVPNIPFPGNQSA